MINKVYDKKTVIVAVKIKQSCVHRYKITKNFKSPYRYILKKGSLSL